MSKELEEANWYYIAGKEYYDAYYILILQFDVLINSWVKQIQRPSYYCGGLAVESFLKAYLTIQKIKFPDHNHKGHDLKNLISLDRNNLKNFFALDDTDLQQIYILNERYYDFPLYGRDDLRYGRRGGLRKSPHPDNLSRILSAMERKIFGELIRKFQQENPRK